MSRKFFGLMAVAGVAVAAGLGGLAQDAQAGLFGFFRGHHHGGSCDGGYCDSGYAACSGSCDSYVSHREHEYDDDDACGHHHHHGHHNHGCYSPCGHVYAEPAPSCGSCSTSTCCSAPVSTCGSPCGAVSHCGSCGSSCGGYATSVSYGGCSACGGVVTSGCPNGNCGVVYGSSPMPVESTTPAAPAPPQGEEAPAPPAEDGTAPAEEPAA